MLLLTACMQCVWDRDKDECVSTSLKTSTIVYMLVVAVSVMAAAYVYRYGCDKIQAARKEEAAHKQKWQEENSPPLPSAVAP